MYQMIGVGRLVFDNEVEEKRILSAVVGICVFVCFCFMCSNVGALKSKTLFTTLSTCCVAPSGEPHSPGRPQFSSSLHLLPTGRPGGFSAPRFDFQPRRAYNVRPNASRGLLPTPGPRPRWSQPAAVRPPAPHKPQSQPARPPPQAKPPTPQPAKPHQPPQQQQQRQPPQPAQQQQRSAPAVQPASQPPVAAAAGSQTWWTPPVKTPTPAPTPAPAPAPARTKTPAPAPKQTGYVCNVTGTSAVIPASSY